MKYWSNSGRTDPSRR